MSNLSLKVKIQLNEISHLIIFGIIIYMNSISLAFSRPINTEPCPKVEPYNVDKITSASELEELLLSRYPIGSRADCFGRGGSIKKMIRDIPFNTKPMDLREVGVIRYILKVGTFIPKEYLIEKVPLFKDNKNEKWGNYVEMFNKIAGIHVRQLSDREIEKKRNLINSAIDFSLSRYEDEKEAEKAFLLLHPLGSSVEAAHYTLLKAGFSATHLIDEDFNKQNTDIIMYVYKKGLLGWNQIRVQIERPIINHKVHDEIEKIVFYRSYQGL